jgi:ribose transport system substrate-binding protein
MFREVWQRWNRITVTTIQYIELLFVGLDQTKIRGLIFIVSLTASRRRRCCGRRNRLRLAIKTNRSREAIGRIMKLKAVCLLIGFVAVLSSGCTKRNTGGVSSNSTSAGATNRLKNDKYEFLDTRTDQFDFAKAKSLAQDAIARYPELNGMVGLFAYNPPKILEAVREANKLDSIEVIGFDEEDGCLQGIVDGEIAGTVVQNPYMYGYESVRILAALVRGDKSVLPEDGFLNIEARKITQDNVQEFWDELRQLTKKDESGGSDNKQDGRPTVAFVTNGIASFWVIAEKGARDAGKEFDVNVLVRMPPKGLADQKRMCEELLAQKVDGIAISPINPKNQQDLLDEIAERTNLITQDSDAPNSKRLCYVGMDNYTAGRMCGELLKDAMPDGGKIMIFVGRVDQLNARQRRQGLIDEVLDRSFDPTRFDAP